MSRPSPTTEELAALERLLHHEIPLTRAMAVRVAGWDHRGLRLTAPLAANINHKSTAFGGSLYTLATLAGWGMVQLLVRGDTGAAPPVVIIQHGSMDYLQPLATDLVAVCAPPDGLMLQRFQAMLDRKGRARLALSAEIDGQDGPAARFSGSFVALRAPV